MENAMIILLFVLILLILILSLFAFFFAINATIDVKALQNSTHTMVQNFAPIDPDDDFGFDEEWKNTEREIDKQIKRSEDVYLGLVPKEEGDK